MTNPERLHDGPPPHLLETESVDRQFVAYVNEHVDGPDDTMGEATYEALDPNSTIPYDRVVFGIFTDEFDPTYLEHRISIFSGDEVRYYVLFLRGEFLDLDGENSTETPLDPDKAERFLDKLRTMESEGRLRKPIPR